MPSLLLQPLLENAIGHGIEPLPEGGTVTVDGRVDGDEIAIEVGNPVSQRARAVRSGNRMALDNIRQRLELVFRAGPPSRWRTGEDYRVTLRFPWCSSRQSRPTEVTARVAAGGECRPPMKRRRPRPNRCAC